MSLQDRNNMTCHKCGKFWHFASQCQIKPQGFQSGQFKRRPPQSVRNIQEANELTGFYRDDIGRNRRTANVRGTSRISTISGKLQSMHGKRGGRKYRLLVDSAAAINLIKQEIHLPEDKIYKFHKKFIMGNDEHISEKPVYLNNFNKKQLFHILNDDFPLPEDGIIGMHFSKNMLVRDYP